MIIIAGGITYSMFNVNTESAIDELVNTADGAKVKDFLIDILKENPLLLQQFKLINHCAISSADIKIYTREKESLPIKDTPVWYWHTAKN